MSGHRRTDFTENLEAVAHGVRHLEEIRDPILREAIAAALRLRERELRLDPASRARMRNTVLAALAPAKPTIADRLYGVFAMLGKPAPLLVRSLVVVVVIAGLAGGATVASADSLPDDLLYGFKLAGEQLRLAVAVSSEDRASVKLSIAEHRLDEAERLASAGWEDAAIVATASYGSSLADAAADLATVESTDPRAAALVQQLQATLAASRQRIATTATKLATDARTVSIAKVLAAVSATAAPSTDSPATKIADQAAAITARLAAVADARARGTDTKGAARPTATSTPQPTVGPAGAPSTARPTSAIRAPLATLAPAAQPGATNDDDDSTVAPSTTTVPPFDRVTARAAAERAKEAAEQAHEAAAKAKRAASRTASPSPIGR